MDGDRQIQADSDMSVELLLVLLYVSIMAGEDRRLTLAIASVRVCERAAESDRARWTHPYLDTHKLADEIISR